MPKKYLVATIICCPAAIVGAFAIFVACAEPGNFAYGKALPIVLPFLSLFVFGIVWFPVLLVLLWMQRAPRRLPEIAMVAVSGLAFIPAIYRVGEGIREKNERENYFHLVSQPKVTVAEIGPLIDAYSAESQRGAISGVWWREQVLFTLLSNRSTSPEILQRMADSLDFESRLWYELAAHPNLPKAEIDRCLTKPHLAIKLARNPQASPEFLSYLATLPYPSMDDAVARNFNTPRATLVQIARKEPNDKESFARRNLEGRLGNWAWR